MKWLACLVVIGLGLAWLGSRSLDMGVGVLDQAVAAHQEAQRRSERMAPGTDAAIPPPPARPSPAVVAPAPPAPTLVVAPKPAPDVRVTADLVGLTRDAVERRLGSPTGRIYATREEWWYDRRVLVFRDGRVVAIE